MVLSQILVRELHTLKDIDLRITGEVDKLKLTPLYLSKQVFQLTAVFGVSLARGENNIKEQPPTCILEGGWKERIK